MQDPKTGKKRNGTAGKQKKAVTDSVKLKPTIGRLLHEHRKHLGWLAGAMASGIVGAGVAVGFAWAIIGLTNGVLQADSAGFNQWMLNIGILFLGGAVFSVISSYMAGRYVNHVMRDLRDNTADRLMRIRLPELEKHRSGDLLSLVGNDLGQVGTYLEGYLPTIAFHAAWLVLALGSAVMISWELLLMSFAAVPIIMSLVSLVGKPVQTLTTKQNEALGDANVITQDAVSGQVEIKAFGLQGWLQGRHDQATDQWVRDGEVVLRARIKMGMTNFLNVLIPLLVMGGMGAVFVLNGRLTAPEVIGFISVSNGLINPIMALGQILGETRKAAGACERLWQLYELPLERVDGRDLPILENVPLVEMRNINFSYDRENADGESVRQQVFDGFNLDIRKGESIAVVGGSGSGKSTLLKLIAGLHEPDSGQVRFGGHAQSEWSLPAMRRHMALVQQETYLFPGSLGENIAIGAMGDRALMTAGSSVADGEIGVAAEHAHVAEFIRTLPDGYESDAGERGARLSGGQRQRIGIARAALRDTEILLLDEPTSALDTATEQAVQHELERLMTGRTSVVVAHRLSTVRNADRILVLEGGRVVEEGSHEDLMSLKGRYWELVRNQADGEACA